MKKSLLPLLALLLLLQSCTNDKKKAQAFCDRIEEINLTIQNKGREWGSELQPAFTMQDYSKVREKTDALSTYISRQIDSLGSVKDVAGSEKLRTTMIEYLKFENLLVGEVFTPFTKMDSTTTDEQRQVAVQRLQDRSKDEAEYLQKVREVKAEYMTKNKLK